MAFPNFSARRHSVSADHRERFRADRRQKLVATFATLTIFWTLWAFAGTLAVPITVTAVLATLTFAMLFLPTGERGCGAGAKENFKRLVKFPLFWIGLLLCVYIAIQGLNPSYAATWRGGYWTNFRLSTAIDWLPTGFRAEFGYDVKMGMNAWRQLCIFGSAWLVLCSLWCGVRSRSVWRVMLWAFILNAVVLACFGLYKISIGSTSYLGNRRAGFTSVFVYKNHAAEFFTLSIAICAGMAFRIWRRAAELGARGGAHMMLIVFGLILLGMVFATKSVGGVALASLWLPLTLVLVIFSGLATRSSWAVFGIFFLLLLGLAGTWWATVDTGSFFRRVDQKVEVGELPDVERDLLKISDTAGSGENADDSAAPASKGETFSLEKGPRADLRKLSSVLYHMDPHVEIFGWGAGSYRWIAPRVMLRMEEFLVKNRWTGKYYLPARTEYAHCDPWQMLVEWGAVGAGIFASGVIWFFAFAAYNFRRWHVSSAALFAGTVIFAAHSLFDFVTYNPALLLTLALLVAAFKHDLSRAGAR